MANPFIFGNAGGGGGTPSIPFSINGTEEETLTGAFNLVATLDGTPGGTYNAATDTLAFTSTGGWVRPSYWRTLPTLTAASEAGYILLFVYENRLNRFTLQIPNGTVDWGDGTTSAASAAIRTKTYTYSSIAQTVFVDAQTGENYKQVIIGITRLGAAITYVDFTVASATFPMIETNYAVDWNISFPNATTLLMGGVYQREQLYAKRVRLWAVAAGYTKIAQIKNLEVLELPATRGGTWVNGNFVAVGPCTLSNQDWGTSTNVQSVFGSSYFVSHGNMSGNSLTQMAYYISDNILLRSFGSVNLPVVQNISYAWSGCQVLQSIGLINVPLATNYDFAFTYSKSLNAVYFTDCSVCTSVVQMINYCAALQVLMMPNLTRGINFTNSSIGNYGMNLFASGGTVNIQGTNYTLGGIGTASGFQTITITNTPFGVLVTAADATAVAIALVLTGKGYTIAN
jgi:hypothetical protein